MKVNKIAIIGCGNLGTSILNGLISSEHYSNAAITATRRKVSSLEKYKSEGVHITADNAKAVQQADILLISLKPFNILEVLAELKPHLTKDKTIVSLATGISISQIEEVVGSDMSIYRAMPNTAADVKESLTCICANHAISEEDEVTEIFNSVGKSIVIEEG